MIAKLHGVVDSMEADSLVLMVGGVGYRVFVPTSTAHRLTVQEEATLNIYTHVREDAILLYGFHGKNEQRAFEILLTVTGIGPKLALSVLSHLSVEQLVRAVRGRDSRTLTQVPGVGRKTAERMLLELKDRFESWPVADAVAETEALPETSTSGAIDDAIAALVQLGYAPETSRAAVASVSEGGGNMSVEEILRAALRRLQSV